MKNKFFFSPTLFLFLVLIQSSHAQQTRDLSDHIRTWKEGMECIPANLDQVEWMQGNWGGPLENGSQQHVLMARTGDQMPGFAWGWTTDGAVMFYEVNVFVQVGECVEYRVKHMSSELSAWEGQDGFVRHRLLDFTDDALYFDGITFEKNGPDGHTVYLRLTDGEIITVNQKRMPL